MLKTDSIKRLDLIRLIYLLFRSANGRSRPKVTRLMEVTNGGLTSAPGNVYPNP